MIRFVLSGNCLLFLNGVYSVFFINSYFANFLLVNKAVWKHRGARWLFEGGVAPRSEVWSRQEGRRRQRSAWNQFSTWRGATSFTGCWDDPQHTRVMHVHGDYTVLCVTLQLACDTWYSL